MSNLPFSYSNEAVENNLKAAGFCIKGRIQFERARTPDGMLTDWRTGRRTVQVEPPKIKLPRNSIKMGDFTAYLYYRDTRNSQKCFKCFEVGHRAAECPNNEVCLACEQPGHRQGDSECSVVTEQHNVLDLNEVTETDEVSEISQSNDDTDVEAEIEESSSIHPGDASSDQRQEDKGGKSLTSSIKGKNAEKGNFQEKENIEKAELAKEMPEPTDTVSEVQGESKEKNKSESEIDDTNSMANLTTLKGKKMKKKGKHSKLKHGAKKQNLNDTPTSINSTQSHLSDFGIGCKGDKRTIDETASPDGNTGSPINKKR